jgi:hypothetical protein
MTEPLCKEDKFYDHVCQVILLSLYFNKHAKLQELRNTVDLVVTVTPILNLIVGFRT